MALCEGLVVAAEPDAGGELEPVVGPVVPPGAELLDPLVPLLAEADPLVELEEPEPHEEAVDEPELDELVVGVRAVPVEDVPTAVGAAPSAGGVAVPAG